MRRIIAAALAAALTACADPSGRSPDADVPRAPERDPVPAGAAPTSPAATSAAAPTAPERIEEPGTVLFVGTSLTAGYGIGADRAYPALLQQRIDSAGMPFRVSNAGLSGETSAGGLRRIDWVLQSPMDVLVLELGGNDALRGLDPGLMEENLDAILRRARETHPDADIVLLGMEAPPNLGSTYTQRFRRVFRDLARRHDAVLVPFLLEGVAADPSLNQADGIHPNEEGHRRMAATVWRALAPVLAARAAPASAR